MKNIILVLIGCLSLNLATSQTISVDDETCNYNLEVDGVTLTKLGNCLFQSPQIVDGAIYSLQVADIISGPGTLDIFDLVELREGLISGFNAPLKTYIANLDRDDAVSTYDLIQLASVILKIDQTPLETHIIGPNTIVPSNIDRFDFDLDYSTLEFTSEDFTSDIMNISVFRLGNINGD